jgi:hypothetical protein
MASLAVLMLAALAGCTSPKGPTMVAPLQLNKPMMAASSAVQTFSPDSYLSQLPFPNCTISFPPSTGVLQSSTDLNAWTDVTQLTNQGQATLPMDAPFAFFRAAIISTSITLAWDASADPIVTGYNVYYGGASGAYTNTVNAGNKTNATVFGLIPLVTYYFAATTYAASGMESPFSNEVHCLVPAPGLRITKTQ